MPDLFDRVRDNWDLVAAVITSTAGTVWTVAHVIYRKRIEDQQAHIALLKQQIEDYKNRLGGASPDEARAKIDELMRRLGPPYPFSQPQQDRLTAALTRTDPATRFPVHVMSPVDAAQYGEWMMKVFESSGWKVTFEATPFMRSEASGIHVLKPEGSQLAGTAHALIARSLMNLLDEAGVEVGSAEQTLRPNQVILLVARPPI